MNEEKEKNTFYLEEDKDLLAELDSWELNKPTIGSIKLGELERKISTIQIKAILRNRKTASDLDKSTTRYSVGLIVLTAVLFVIALAQLSFDILTSDHQLIGLIIMILCAAVTGFIFGKFNLDKIMKK